MAVPKLFLWAQLFHFLVLSKPEQLYEYSSIKYLADSLGIIEPSQLLLPAAVVCCDSNDSCSYPPFNLWLNGRLAAAIGSDLSCEAYKRTLFQPFEVHIQRNSSEVITGTTTHNSNCCSD